MPKRRELSKGFPKCFVCTIFTQYNRSFSNILEKSSFKDSENITKKTPFQIVCNLLTCSIFVLFWQLSLYDVCYEICPNFIDGKNDRKSLKRSKNNVENNIPEMAPLTSGDKSWMRSHSESQRLQYCPYQPPLIPRCDHKINCKSDCQNFLLFIKTIWSVAHL